MANWVPILISLTALASSFGLGFLALRDRRLTIRLSREREILDWIGELKGIYSSLQVEDQPARSDVLDSLCIVIDYGRLYFPNDAQGYRSAVLDPLIETRRRCADGNFDAGSIRKDWRAFIDTLNDHTTPFRLESSPEAIGRRQYKNSGK